MKYIFLTLLSVISITVFSQDKDPLHLFDSTRKSATFDSVYKDVKGALAGMADGLKTTADHVYSVLVFQQRINAFLWILLTGFNIIPFIYFVKSLKSKYAKRDAHGDLNKEGVIMLLLGIVSFGWMAVNLMHLDVIVGGLLNPEYGALHEILDSVK